MLTNKTVMLVEDDPDDRELFIEALNSADAEIVCVTANDGQDALEKLFASKTVLPDLIVMDLRMPKLNGEKCLRAIRSEPRFNDVPIIIYTTSRSTSEAKELSALGAVHFMSKPTSQEDIYYLVSMMVEEYCTR